MTTHSIKEVSSFPVLLSPPVTHSGLDITIQHLGLSGVILIGGSNISEESYGFKLLAGTAISFPLHGKDDLYAIASGTSSPISVGVLTLGLV